MTDTTDNKHLFCAIGSDTTAISDDELQSQLVAFLDHLGEREDVLILPPDFTRFHSQAGKITRMITEHYNFIPSSNATTTTSTSTPAIEILPALGTHAPMTKEQIKTMFGDELSKKQSQDPDPFLVHDWRNDVVTIGHAPKEMVSVATRGMVEKPWPAQLNKKVWEKRLHDPAKQKHKSLVLSIGQVVPHEVMGMANFNKNLFVGTGGVEAINLSHFIGAVYGMEKMMGRASNPLRSILNYSSEKYLQNELDLWYILTVVGANTETGKLEMKGLYIGNDLECYTQACELSLQANFTMLESAPSKMVVHLDGDEFHSTWLGNKAIYRTRMAIADGGELIILAPGVRKFGEDDKIDDCIREFGYFGTDNTMKALEDNPELKDNLGAVAHLIHGSSEGRFSVTYCPGYLTKEEIEGVGFKYAELAEMKKRYPVETLKDGWNEDATNGKFFYISNPALGLWATKDRFE